MIELTCKRCATMFSAPEPILKTRARFGQKISCPLGHRHTVEVQTSGVIVIGLVKKAVAPTPSVQDTPEPENANG